MILKLEPVTVLLVVLLIFGSGTGGFFLGRSTKPDVVYETNNISQYQTQEQWQAVIDIEIEDVTFRSNIMIMIQEKTNIQVMTISNFETNIIHEPLIGFPKFPIRR